MAIKQDLTVGAEVPDLAGVMHRIIADRSSEGFDDTPPIVALCLGFNNRVGTDWVKKTNPGFGFQDTSVIHTIVNTTTGFKAFGNSFEPGISATGGFVLDSKNLNQITAWEGYNMLGVSNFNETTILDSIVIKANSEYILAGGTSGRIYRINAAGTEAQETNASSLLNEFDADGDLIRTANVVSFVLGEDRVYAFTNTGTILWSFFKESSPTSWVMYEWRTSPPSDKTLPERIADYTGLNVSITSVAFGNGVFVAAGTSGFMAYSNDLTSWKLVPDSRFGLLNIHSVNYANSLWLAVGQSGIISKSTDGINWTRVTDPKFETTSINNTAFGGSLWIAVGNAGKMSYSRDGDSWAVIDTSSFPGSNGIADLHCVTFSSGKWVAGGSQGIIATSVNGVSQGAGQLRYYDKDGTVPAFSTYLPLDVTIEDVPPHDYNKDFKVEQGRFYKTRNGKKVFCDGQPNPISSFMKTGSLALASEFKVRIIPQDSAFLGIITSYDVWYTGRRYADKTDSSDIMEEWRDPVEGFMFLIADKYDPFAKASWEPYKPTTNETYTSVSDIFTVAPPAGKTRYQVNLREVVADSEILKMVADGEK